MLSKTSNRINPKKSTFRHIMFKLLKTKYIYIYIFNTATEKLYIAYIVAMVCMTADF